MITASSRQQAWLRLDPADNLIVTLRDMLKGERVDPGAETVTLTQAVQAKHSA